MLLNTSLYGQGGLTSVLQDCQCAIQTASALLQHPQNIALDPPQAWSQRGPDPSQLPPANVQNPRQSRTDQQHQPMPHHPQQPLTWAQRMQVLGVQSPKLDADLEQDFLPGDNDAEDADLGWGPEAQEHFSSGKGGGGRKHIQRHGKGSRRRK
jgi:hypothetical protein